MAAGRWRQRASRAAGSGGSSRSRSSSRTSCGSPASCSGLTSRTGASALATCSHQSASTRSARTSVRSGAPVRRTVRRCPAARTTVPHSSGSSRSWASRQTLKTRTPGPSVSTCTMPGTSRRCRAPSAITRTSGSLNIALPMEEPSTRRRAWIWATSSEIRLAVDSGSLPTATTGPAPPPGGRRCGSHRTQAQPSARERSERTTTRRSRGLCRTADWATSQRASAWTAGPVPATPTTPNSATSMPIGTSGMLQRTRRWFSSRAGSSISFTDGWSTVPIRSTR